MDLIYNMDVIVELKKQMEVFDVPTLCCHHHLVIKNIREIRKEYKKRVGRYMELLKLIDNKIEEKIKIAHVDSDSDS